MAFRLVLAAWLLTIPACAQLVSITGFLFNPDGSNFNGSVSILLTRSTVRNTCVTPSQAVTFQPVTVRVTNGVLGSLQLYASPCLSPAQCYSVSIRSSSGNALIYSTKWYVPNSSPQDISALDANLDAKCKN